MIVRLSQTPRGSTVLLQRQAIHLALIYLAVSFVVAWLFWLLAWLNTRHSSVLIPLMPALFVGSFGPFIGAGVSTWIEGGARWIAGNVNCTKSAAPEAGPKPTCGGLGLPAH